MFSNYCLIQVFTPGKGIVVCFSLSTSFNLLVLLLTQDCQLDRDAFRNVPLVFKLMVTFTNCIKENPSPLRKDEDFLWNNSCAAGIFFVKWCKLSRKLCFHSSPHSVSFHMQCCTSSIYHSMGSSCIDPAAVSISLDIHLQNFNLDSFMSILLELVPFIYCICGFIEFLLFGGNVSTSPCPNFGLPHNCNLI